MFPVVNSSAPNVPNALALSEDGNDYTYFSTLSFGSQGQEMYMLIDSGSSNTWVMSSDCQSSACQTHNLFDSQASTSVQTTKQTWSMTYGTGEVDGVVAKDTVAIANYTVNLSFGLATTASDEFNSYPMDGILGLGRPASDGLGAPTIMQVLDTQGHLDANILGIHLQRAADNSNNGQLTFGGVDSSKFDGKLSYSKTINDQNWQINADDAGVGTKAVGFQAKTAIIDTGTSYILMPPNDAAALHQLIPGSSQSGEMFTIPCSSSESLFFTISGVKYTVSSMDYVGKSSGSGCQSNIIGHQAFGVNDWILGDVFLKNVYTVLDFDDARIGFGTMSGAASNSSDQTPSTTTGSPSVTTGKASSTTVPPTGGSSATTFTMSTTKSGRSSTSASSATATSSGIDDSDPFSQAGNTGSPASSSSSSSAAAASESRSSLLLATMLLAFVIGFTL
jgi:cathepsin D